MRQFEFISDSHPKLDNLIVNYSHLDYYRIFTMSDLSPDYKQRMRAAKEWLIKHPKEKQTTAAKIFKVNRKALNSSILRPSNRQQGGHNKILSTDQEVAIHKFIRSYLQHGQNPTRDVVFSAICYLRRQADKPPPSQIWFSKWWKAQPLRKIKTKPIARVRITAQDEKEVEEWFEEYKEVLEKYRIKRKDIHNFDESGFRVGCPRGIEVLVPIDIKEV